MRPKLFMLAGSVCAWCAAASAQVLTNGSNDLDMDQNGTVDFSFQLLTDCPSGGFLRAVPTGPGAGVVSHMIGQGAYADSLQINTEVGPGLSFGATANLMTCGFEGTVGVWGPRGTDAYLGAKLNLRGEVHYAWFLVRHHTSGVFVLLDGWAHPGAGTPIMVGDHPGGQPQCHCADFNRDGDIGTDLDIEDFFRCIGGDCCIFCETADFNQDGDVGTDADIDAFFRALSSCC